MRVESFLLEGFKKTRLELVLKKSKFFVLPLYYSLLLELKPYGVGAWPLTKREQDQYLSTQVLK